MSINEYLIESTEHLLHNYECHADQFRQILVHDVSFEERQRRAVAFVGEVFKAHGKETLLSYLAELARVEHGIQELQPRQRDHVVHAVRVFLLGIHLNDVLLHGTVTPLQWKVAGLTHDVGYPVEIASRVADPLGRALNSMADRIESDIPRVRRAGPRLENLDLLTHGVSGIAVIQECLSGWHIDVNAADAYREGTDSDRVCHGVVGAMAVLRVIDMLYSKSNPDREFRRIVIANVDWNQQWFIEENVPACAAIFLHNLNARWFHATRVDRRLAPVAFLLRLADSLQEWDRPSGDDADGVSPNAFRLEMADGKLSFRAEVEEKRKEDLRKVLTGTLVADDVIVL
jgi:hypothetical protein